MIKQQILSSNSWIKQNTEQARHCCRLEQNRQSSSEWPQTNPKKQCFKTEQASNTEHGEIKLILEAIQCDEYVHAPVVEREITKSK